MRDRHLILICILSFLAVTSSFAKELYVSQSGLGLQNGSDVNNSGSLAWVNNSMNWNGDSGTILPGDEVHLVGTFSGALTLLGSGSLGNPITIVFEPGANFTAACWPPTGAINLNSQSNIVIDGGLNGLIQNTHNGTGMATNSSVGIGGLVYFGTIQNVTITNIYRKTKGVLDDSRQGYPISVYGSSITVSNCTLSDGDCGISYSAQLSAQSNYFVLSNRIFNCNHSAQIGMGNSHCLLSNVVFANNYLDRWDVWDCPGNTAIHLDGIWIWNNTYDTSSILDGVKIYGNKFGGYVGTRTTSSLAFYIYNGRYQLRNVFIFNNQFQCYAPGSWGGGFVATVGSNVWVFNNTVIGTYSNGVIYGGRFIIGQDAAYCYNNLMVYGSGLQLTAASSNVVSSSNSGANTENILTNYFPNVWTDYNVFADGGNDLAQFGCEYDQAASASTWISGNITGLANWQSWIGNNRGMLIPIWNTAHADPHSTTSMPTFVNGTYIPATTDRAARGRGTNLTFLFNSIGVAPTDLNGSPRPAAGAWTIGAYQGPAGTKVLSPPTGLRLVNPN
jgi:hypothetical protein